MKQLVSSKAICLEITKKTISGVFHSNLSYFDLVETVASVKNLFEVEVGPWKFK